MAKSPLRDYRKPLEISSWATFAIALIFYWITSDQGVSYWDCPEYVILASKMEVGHPPGNPVWILAMRMATIFFPSQVHAYIINLCSGLFMAFAAFFLCRIIFVPTRIYLQRLSDLTSKNILNLLSILIALGSSLCFALCDSAWFSATEAEVYAMSAFLTSLSLWIMMVWWFEKSKSKQYRLLILLAYLTGLSLGVHQLNLLLIPVFALVYFYRTHLRAGNFMYSILWISIACGVIGLILFVLIPGLLYGAQAFELFGVNALSMPYNSGVILYCLIILILSIIVLTLSNKNYFFKRYSSISLSLWMLAFVILGFSSFGLIIIRANAYPPMNEGMPDNIFSFSSYFGRDQYPSPPLLYGETPYSRPMVEEEIVNGKPSYSKYILEKEKALYQPITKNAKLNYRSRLLSHEDSILNEEIINRGHGYVISDYKFQQKLTPELNMWFPRITSRKINDRLAYGDWAGMTEKTMDRIPISEAIDSDGTNQPRIDMWGNRSPVYSYRPTYIQQFKYFLSYQTFYMYFRYLFWNFMGRQNDFHSIGEIEHGNFITGIPYLDDKMIGPTSKYPSELWSENKGRNRYYGIPFMIGIVGIIWLLFGNRNQRRILSIITLLFFMTGIAIVIYLNQSPGEPRERDYTFLGSYMSFVMWIAAGLLCFVYYLVRFFPKKLIISFCCLLVLAPSTLMAVENFDDHDRRGRVEPTFYASSLLDFELPALIFSQGDNSTFPLWYASEVLDMGQNHTPVDITYMSLPSYIVNLKKQGEKGLSTMITSPEMDYGAFVISKIPADSISQPMPLSEALKELYSSNETIPIFPSSLIKLPSSINDTVTINLHDFTGGSSFLYFKQLLLLDLIATQLSSENPKVLFFPTLIDNSFNKPLLPHSHPVMSGKIFAPWLPDSTLSSYLKKSVERELSKIEKTNQITNYNDPLITDQSTRYRGELIMAATELLHLNDIETPKKIVSVIEEKYPYSKLLPGNFTVEDSTYYEGKEYRNLLHKMYELTDDQFYLDKAQTLDSIVDNRYNQWITFYQALTPSQRKTLSNRSRRLLFK